MRTAKGAAWILLALLAVGCATKSIYITVKRPAEINLKGYDKIALGDIVNARGRPDQHATDIADEITAGLFASGHFEVLDRQHLKTIMEEHKLGLTGLVDETTAAALGELIGAAVLVFGRIQEDNYDEKTSKDEPWKDKKGKSHQEFKRKGAYDLSVNLKVVDIQTGKILAVKTLSARYKKTKTEDNKPAPKIDSSGLYASCVGDIKGQFMKMVAPYDVSVKASFQTDAKLPEATQAVTQFQIGEWDEGVALLERATKRSGLEPKIQAKAFYNLGLAQMYGGENDAAIVNFKRAMGLQPSSSLYQNAIIKAKEEKEKAEALEKQL